MKTIEIREQEWDAIGGYLKGKTKVYVGKASGRRTFIESVVDDAKRSAVAVIAGGLWEME